ncbi:hypothetical protein HanHA300_Chr12g0440681 [Helianthus annuus]|nr:hypothetical protein HanHA300_Chr12g0440681 [Helianthus annuus]KAJ0492847.1 hypothetical protein HanIR_Chr12g0579381 [Helianthus annuus]
MWRGIRSGLVRDCIFGGVFFFQLAIHRAMLDWKAVGMDPIPRSVYVFNIVLQRIIKFSYPGVYPGDNLVKIDNVRLHPDGSLVIIQDHSPSPGSVGFNPVFIVFGNGGPSSVLEGVWNLANRCQFLHCG